MKESKIKVIERSFKKETSVFKDWKVDTPMTYLKCHEHFKKLNDIFITLSAKSMLPNISWIDFTTFCDHCKVLDKNVVLATIDRLFIATNVELDSSSPSENPDKALCRYEFFEILVRLA